MQEESDASLRQVQVQRIGVQLVSPSFEIVEHPCQEVETLPRLPPEQEGPSGANKLIVQNTAESNKLRFCR
jgi:hypothetical protein